jgi:hypothetical protein
MSFVRFQIFDFLKWLTRAVGTCTFPQTKLVNLSQSRSNTLSATQRAGPKSKSKYYDHHQLTKPSLTLIQGCMYYVTSHKVFRQLRITRYRVHVRYYFFFPESLI